MNFNILGFIKEQLSGYVIGKMSDFLGENPYKTASALDNVLPVVLGGVIAKGKDLHGAGQMMEQIKDNGHNGKVFDNLGDTVKDPDKVLEWLASGSNLTNFMLGDNVRGVIDAVSSENDIRKTSASSLMSFLSPLVMGAVGKYVTDNNLGISGIIDLLSSNKSVANEGLSPDMKYALGFSADEEKSSVYVPPVVTTTSQSDDANKPTVTTTSTSKKTASPTGQVTPKPSSGFLRMLLPLLLIGLLASLGYYLFNTDKGKAFFGKFRAKNAVETVSNEGDSLKAKLEQRRKEEELSIKAKELAKKDDDTPSKLIKPKEKSTGSSSGSSSSTKKNSSNSLSDQGFSSEPRASRNTSNRQTSGGKRSRSDNGGYDIIEEIDGSNSFSGSEPTRSSTTRNYSGSSSNQLSQAISGRDRNAEFLLNGISFMDGGYEFINNSGKELDALASVLKRNQRAKVYIQGFGDADEELSQMRAEWVRYALIDRGVKASRIEARGHCQASQSSLSNVPNNSVSMKLTSI